MVVITMLQPLMSTGYCIECIGPLSLWEPCREGAVTISISQMHKVSFGEAGQVAQGQPYAGHRAWTQVRI